MKTQVCVIGAGPAGLLLGHLLRTEGIDCIVLERQQPDYILGRIRAGVLESITVSLMERLGLDGRMKAEGLWHDGFNLASDGRLIRIDLADLVDQRVMVYGQTELTRDLMDAREERGLQVVYGAQDVRLDGFDGDLPVVNYRLGESERRVECRFIVGCDGFHGPSRKTLKRTSAGPEFERVYPFGWLGILADVPPCSHELIYSNHERGFALASMRSQSRSRYYIDVPITERIEDWPDERVWNELELRLGPVAAANLTRGQAIEKSIAPLRSYVFGKMRQGSLMLCGDAAHIVPPTGAKGLNLAASDVHYAAEALSAFFKSGDGDQIGAFSERALSRVWKAERFSWSLTRLLHCFPEDGSFERAMQAAEFDYIASSRAAQTAIAENYVGLPV